MSYVRSLIGWLAFGMWYIRHPAATDKAIGIIVWRVDSAEKMQRIYDNDPAVKAGIGYPELHPFCIGLLTGR